MSEVKSTRKRVGNNPPEELGFITITTEDALSLVQCHIRGEFLPAEMVSKELSTLHAMSHQFDNIEFTINSPGGSADTLIELLQIKDQFKHSVGIATGQAASAGSLLWAACDFRVIYPYTSLMFHRESYFYAGKAAHHLDHTLHTDKLFGEMMPKLLEGILTEEELEDIKRNEVYLTPDELISRDVAASWETYKQMQDINFSSTELIALESGHLFLLNKATGKYMNVLEMRVDDDNLLSETQLKYLMAVDGFEDPDEEEFIEEEPKPKKSKPKKEAKK